MNIGDNQEQNADGGSTAIQAGRDVHYYGMSVSDVKDLCELILRDNFPKLRDEAIKKAEQHVRDFAIHLEQDLAKNIDSIVLEKFSDPDVQAMINDAVQASARKGDKCNPDLLSALIAGRVSGTESDFRHIVIAEAVKVVPNLTGGQIALLSILHFLNDMKIGGLSDVSELEEIGGYLKGLCIEAEAISFVQWQHMQYLGVCSINPFMTGKIWLKLYQDYSYLGYENSEVFRNAASLNAPSIFYAVEKFHELKLYQFTLTSVGRAVALASISRTGRWKVDYSKWLM